MQQKFKKNKKRSLAISQIFILVIGIVAFSFQLGGVRGAVCSTTWNGAKEGIYANNGKTFIEGTCINGEFVPKQIFQPSQTSSTPNPVSEVIKNGLVNELMKRGYKFVDGKWIFGETSSTATIEGAKEIVKEGAKKGSVKWLWDKIPAPITNAVYAVTIYYGIKVVGNMLGVDKELTDAAAPAISVGWYTKQTVKWASTKAKSGEGWVGSALSKIPGLSKIAPYSGLIGLGVGLSIFLAKYRNTKTETIVFDCKPWQASVGGNNCEKCNSQGILGCTEYQCRSLGKSCELINVGTDEEKCAVNQNDVTPPKITIWEGALLNNYKYSSKTATGVKIEYTKSTDGCVPPFNGFTFGFNTDEPAYCKADKVRRENFDDMEYDFGGSNSLSYNHTQFLSLPGAESGNITIEGSGEQQIYVRCQNNIGNTNAADFVFKFCVDKGPDLNEPVIVTTSLLNGMPVGFGVQTTPLQVYTNKPADCKWSTRDQDYERMEHDMSCAQDVGDMNSQMLYTCETTLPDLKDREDNIFYFRCKSYPLKSERVVMSESYKFILKGSQPLVIDEVKPNNEVIKDKTEFVRVSIEVKTSAGYNEGEATCEYSEDGKKYNEFFDTHSYKHKQDLVLTKGTYKFFIKCLDLAGNSDEKTITFNVESDPYAPSVVRVYQEDNKLKIITNEKAECVYTTFGCSYSFDDGTAMTTSDGLNHYTYWNTQTSFYIKCKDEYDNQPLPNECNIIVKPLKI